MPRYEYQCSICNTDFILHHLSSETPEACPGCGEVDSLKKLISTFTTPKDKVSVVTKTGQTTENFIKDARSDLKQYKKKLEVKR
tara:strand:- start:20527 stop:20778 length:252 start_codon:yes stop_codon:yes gene_type:complete